MGPMACLGVPSYRHPVPLLPNIHTSQPPPPKSCTDLAVAHVHKAAHGADEDQRQAAVDKVDGWVGFVDETEAYGGSVSKEGEGHVDARGQARERDGCVSVGRGKG